MSSPQHEYPSFLFTLLVHNGFFEAVVSLLETSLCIFSQTYYDWHNSVLVNMARPATIYRHFFPRAKFQTCTRFNIRQLAQCSRMLILLILEPEDRHTVENASSPCTTSAMALMLSRRNPMVRGELPVDATIGIILARR
jgi:hypothetical protein